MTADEVIELLDLKPHPEGGVYREAFIDAAGDAGRPHSTAIYFLLRHREVSHWHRIDSAEVWHWYAGAPLAVTVYADGGNPVMAVLGADLRAGQHPQFVVPPSVWQTAVSLGSWSLVGCTVAPGFDFAKFELAPPDWHPPKASSSSP